ncbi:hypothetical protein CEE37_07600 [candidate division LCP-89 bacterium B3_LCP]|uniref:Uncharacterized protein n=1 Tax=candidate division LCP-89 bacterium B3_LCP TaxID=2012998 RepID=A0A532V0T7_UNCL8|nr:MAG: hypothetical protein CEE37_07600 [candidate division LCP-89 bacterium B3_LCP]
MTVRGRMGLIFNPEWVDLSTLWTSLDSRIRRNPENKQKAPTYLDIERYSHSRAVGHQNVGLSRRDGYAALCLTQPTEY